MIRNLFILSILAVSFFGCGDIPTSNDSQDELTEEDLLSEEKTDAITGIGPDTNTADYKVIFHCTSHIQRVPTAISPPGRMYGQCLCQYQGKEISY